MPGFGVPFYEDVIMITDKKNQSSNIMKSGMLKVSTRHHK